MRTIRSLLSLVVAATVLVALAPAAPAATPPAVTWSVELPGAAIRESSPLLADLDGDGTLDVVVGARDGKVYALRGKDGGSVAGWPQATTNPIDSSPSMADVDGDGRPEVFIGSGSYAASGGALYSFSRTGALRFRRELKDQSFNNPSVFSTPALGDLDHNNSVDVAAASLGVASAWQLSGSGAPLSGYPYFWDDTIFSSPALADVNGDGTTDMVIGGDSTAGGRVDFKGGIVRALTSGGRGLWEFRVDDIVRSSPSIGDIDGDGRLDVVFGVGDFYGGNDSTAVFALDAATGQLKWRRATNGLVLGSPALADVNGDGKLDVAVATFPSGHGKGAGGSLYVLKGADGSDVAHFPVSVGAGAQAGVVTGDVDGDGGQDLLVPTGAWVAVVSGKTGSVLYDLAQNTTTGFQSSPAVGDIDGDGRIDVVAAGTKANGRGVVFRWELPAASKLGLLTWPQFRKDSRRTGSWTTGLAPSTALAFSRVAGSDRFATAVALSSGTAAGVDVLYVATGTSFADALAGGPAAGVNNTSVLLVNRDEIPTTTIDRLRQVKPKRIVVLGGSGAVSDSVVSELAGYATSGVSRAAGSDRYATAAAVSSQAFPSAGVPVVYIATGANFPDALAGAAGGALKKGPVLLVPGTEIPSSTSTELRRLAPKSIVILGGPSAVSASVEQQLSSYSSSVTRLAGGDRVSTAVAVSKSLFPSGATTAYIATGANFPDALAGGPVAAAAKAPLLLVTGPCLPGNVRAELDRLGATKLVLLGGDTIVPAAIASFTPCS